MLVEKTLHLPLQGALICISDQVKNKLYTNLYQQFLLPFDVINKADCLFVS